MNTEERQVVINAVHRQIGAGRAREFASYLASLEARITDLTPEQSGALRNAFEAMHALAQELMSPWRPLDLDAEIQKQLQAIGEKSMAPLTERLERRQELRLVGR